MKEPSNTVRNSCLWEVGNGAQGGFRITALFFFFVISPIEPFDSSNYVFVELDKK